MPNGTRVVRQPAGGDRLGVCLARPVARARRQGGGEHHEGQPVATEQVEQADDQVTLLHASVRVNKLVPSAGARPCWRGVSGCGIQRQIQVAV